MALKRYMIERDIPEVGSMEREQLSGAAATSNEALAQLAPSPWARSNSPAIRGQSGSSRGALAPLRCSS